MNIQLGRRLVDLFYPLVEFTLFDENGKIQEILNAFSNLKEDQACDNFQAETPFQEILTSGRTVRTLIYPRFRLRYDLTHFKNLQDQLNLLVQAELPKPTTVWKESIDQMIAHYQAEHKINVQALTSKQKRELISTLQNQGLLDFKESTAYVASKLQISRATVYNYLNTSASFKKVHVHQVDAFTNKKFGGNPAGVVLDADDLNESTMRKIARELNLSETVFVFSNLQMRYFTPTGHEIGFCGHSTVGALFMIAKERRFGIQESGDFQFDVKTLCGTLKMEISINEREEIHVAYETPKIRLKKAKMTHEEVAKAAGIDVDLIDQSIPVMYEETNKDLFIVIRSLKNLKKIDCDSKSFANFSKQHDIVALCVLSPEAVEKKNQFHMRCFAPLVGITEDPFTGSVLGGLTALVETFDLLPKKANSFRVEQGHFIQRPGVVEVKFSKKQENYHAKVFAQAVHCFSTEIHL